MIETDLNSYFSDEVKRYDYDRWLVTLFAPPVIRNEILTLLMFYSEISRIRETVSEPMLGDIRLQWWRDALSSIASGNIPAHPVAEALSNLISDRSINPNELRQIIDARSADLDSLPFQTPSELLDYADRTGGILSGLMLKVSGPSTDEGAVIARQVGKAYALSGIIRALPFHIAQDIIRIPAEMIMEKGLSVDTLLVSENRGLFFEIVKGMTNLACQEQEKALELSRGRPKSEKYAYRITALTTLYLRRFKASDYDPDPRKMNVGNLRKIIALSIGR